jgi:hypothetical protein
MMVVALVLDDTEMVHVLYYEKNKKEIDNEIVL